VSGAARLAVAFLLVRDLARSRAVYEALLGRPPEKAGAAEVRFGGEGGAALTLHADLSEAERRSWEIPPEPAVRGWGVYLTVATGDLDGAVARAAAAGARVVRRPGSAPWGGRFALLADPDGYAVEVRAADR
jgi:catechol 2,3-dioxygenase-like lactoylglutathione lyase family enzyme